MNHFSSPLSLKQNKTKTYNSQTVHVFVLSDWGRGRGWTERAPAAVGYCDDILTDNKQQGRAHDFWEQLYSGQNFDAKVDAL